MEIIILNKLGFNDLMACNKISDETVETLPGVALISINDTKGKWSQSWFNQDHPNVLRLWFDDVESDKDKFSPTNDQEVKAFDIEDTKKVLSFIKQNKDKRLFLIHCSAGISRSGAIGRFIADYFRVDKEEFNRKNPHILPNARVLRMLNNKANGRANIE